MACRKLGLSSFTLVLLACSPPQDGAPTAGGVSVRREALLSAGSPPNFRIYNDSFENSAKVIPPGSNAACPDGAIAVSLGQQDRQLLSRALMSGGSIYTGDATTKFALPLNAPPSGTIATGTDNQMIRLHDGSLLVERDSGVWSTMDPAPSWANESVLGHIGQRGSPALYRSTDCGNTWSLYSIVNLGTLFGGVYGKPRPMNSAGGVDVGCAAQNPDPNGLRWWVGGMDRTEIYSCPFTGNVYLTTGAVSGPYCPENSVRCPDKDVMLVLFSGNQGLTWQLIAELPRNTPGVMTSTPDGRFYVFSQSCGTPPAGSCFQSGSPCGPTLFYTNRVGPGEKPTFISPPTPPPSCDTNHLCGFEVPYVDPVTGVAAPFQQVAASAVQQAVNANTPSISRISTDRTTSKVRVAYHTVNGNGMLETRVVRVEVDDDRAPLVKPIVAVHAEDAANHSAMYSNVTQPDLLDMPAGTRSSNAMAYWIEAPRVGQANFGIRHMFFEGDCRATTPRYLSVDAKHAPRKWQTRIDIGDYFAGGSWWGGGKLNYFAHWSEPSPTTGTSPGDLTGAVTASPFGLSAPDAHVWKQGLSPTAFASFNGLAGSDGWQVAAIDSYVLPGGEIRVDGVWHNTATPTEWLQGFTVEDFEASLGGFIATGFRLETLSTIVLTDGSVRVDALFRQNADTRFGSIQGFTEADFIAQNDARTAAGARLDHLSSFVLPGGEVRLDAVWHEEAGPAKWAHGFTFDDFKVFDLDLATQGYRLDDASSFVLADGQVRIDGVWHLGTEQTAFVWDNKVDDFRSQESDLRCQGYQLLNSSSFTHLDGEVHVDGVFRRVTPAGPVALCQDVQATAGSSCTATVGADMVDNGSFDGTGNPPALTLSPAGPFPRGQTQVTLTATSGGVSSQCTAKVTVADATPPTVVAPPPVSITQCASRATVTVGQATGTDNCGTPSFTGVVTTLNGLPIAPIPVSGGQVQLGLGVYNIQWTSNDGTNSSPTPASQTVTVGPRIESRQSFLVDDRARVETTTGAGAAVANAGAGQTRVGYDARTGGIFSVGPVQVLDRATVNSGILSPIVPVVSPTASAGTVTVGPVILPGLPTLPAFPTAGAGLTVNSGTFTRGPGSYNVFQLNGGTLNLSPAGDFFFRTLTINSAATIRVAAGSRVFVQGQLAYRSPFRALSGTALQTVYLGYAGSSLTMEAPLDGTLVAPSANVLFGTGSGLTFSGSFFASTIEVRPDSRLVCR